MNPKLRHHFGDNPIVWVPAWGISKLRKRAGRFPGAILGQALWYDEWYDRAMSRETARKLADLGVNLVILPFSLGGSAEAEQQERDDYQRMTGHLHEFGVVSLPYFQYQNILQETHRLPETVWAEGLDGRQTQYCYWRRTVCQASEDFIAYMKGLIEDSVGRGADGVWIDNTYKKPCRCGLCLSKFRAFLGEKRAHLLEELRLPDFSRVEPPQTDNLSALSYDPIAQAYMEFLCETNLSIHKTLKAHLESLSPLGLYTTNPGVYRGTQYSERGMAFYDFIKLHDLIYLENKLFPHADGQKGIGNYHGFIAARSLGTMGIPGAWRAEADFDSTTASSVIGLPSESEEIERILFESAAFNGAIGMYWAVRSRSHADSRDAQELREMYFERKPLYEATRRALEFIRTIPVGECENAAEVAVLYHRASLELDFERAAASVHAAEELLHGAGIPYDILFSEALEEARRFRLIVCPDVKLLSDAEASALREYVENGGRVLAIGLFGAHDERNRVREELALADVTGASAFSDAEWVRHGFGEGRATTVNIPGSTGQRIPNMFAGSSLAYPRWTEQSDRLVTEIENLLPNGRQLRVMGEGVLGSTVSRAADGRTVVKLVDYSDSAESRRLRVDIRADLAHSGQAEWRTYGGEPVAPRATAKGDYVSYDLDGFRRFGVLIV